MSNPGPSGINYQGNSNKAKDEAAAQANKPKMESVVSADSVTERRKPLGRRIAESFAGDDARNVGQFILFEVILPSLKTIIFDSASQGLERALFGSESRAPRANQQRVAYNQMHGKPRVIQGASPQITADQQARANHDFSNLVLASRADAEAILDQLQTALAQFPAVTVSDLYDLMGRTTTFTDNRWGWYDLRTARPVRVREGYILDMPRPVPIQE